LAFKALGLWIRRANLTGGLFHQSIITTFDFSFGAVRFMSAAPLATLPPGIQLNIPAQVVPPRVAHRETAILTPARVNVVLETARGRAIFPIATLALAAGMRRGEGLS
jgi:hypothetical protein